ncbi:hypothetical protein [Polaromonas sp. CF318]|uniref:hypothetical protein n=1 Tax=Polaromonas sp. CF318 TaxID=1144318 RepID=UPI0005677196|nr:hypothetical protein [Polaromonas sp. CF318]
MTRNHRYLYRLSLATWASLLVGHLFWYLYQAFAAFPIDETYTNGIGFQLLAFGLMKLPFWLLALVMVLLIEFFLFGRR